MPSPLILGTFIGLAVAAPAASPTNATANDNATDYEHVIDVDYLKNAETVGVHEYSLKDGFQWVEGDMIMRTSTFNAILDRSAAPSDSLLWPKAVVPYTLNPTLSSDMQALVQQAIQDFNQHTCVSELSYADFTSEKAGCFAFMGMSTGMQGINLQNPGCNNKGTVIHEMLHTIGFAHEQSRSDRDTYVSINWDNIETSMYNQFKLLPVGGERDLKTAYDYGSVMHYPDDAFSKNGQDTITSKDSSKQTVIGQRDGFSENDIKEVNMLYQCREDGTSAIGNELEVAKCDSQVNVNADVTFWFGAPKTSCMKGFVNKSGRDLKVICDVKNVPNCNSDPFIMIYIPGKPWIRHTCKPASGKIEEVVPVSAGQVILIFGQYGVALKGDFTCRVSAV